VETNASFEILKTIRGLVGPLDNALGSLGSSPQTSVTGIKTVEQATLATLANERKRLKPQEIVITVFL
jgi:hypothetical protein